jgi:hypothetical protein
MTIFLWAAAALVALWLVAKLVFKTVGCVVHVLLLLAIAAIAYHFFVHAGSRT